MRLLTRGIAWSGVYLALALLPLVVAGSARPRIHPRPFAVELGVACGFIAFALIAIEFALVARLRRAAEPFGIDALMGFHRQMGLAALAFLLLHVTLVGGHGDRLGMLSLASLLALVAVSVGRRRLGVGYEWWQASHRILAALILATALAHVHAVGRYAAAWPVAVVVAGYAGLFLALGLRQWIFRPLWLRRRPWELIENRMENGSTRTLVVRPLGHRGFRFAPGQFAWLSTSMPAPFREQHPMTISSSAEPKPDGRIEFSVKALGDWSRDLVPGLAPGSRLWIDGPYGSFSPDHKPAQGLVLIAGGAGITPMRSILLTMRDRKARRPIVLIFGAHHPERAIFRDELVTLAMSNDLELVFVFEEPPPDWAGERGLITKDVLRRHLPVHAEHHQFFVCGPPPMMDAVEDALFELGVPPANVHTERFDLV
jgi:predicted ferric reductase